MKIKTFVSVSALAAALAGCGGDGDINISPTNIDNSVDNSTGGGTTSNFCASYEKDGTTFQGVFDGTDCTYDETFVDFDNPLTVDLTIPALSEGVHIFTGSLYVGESFGSKADLDAAGITQGGDGPTLTIRAGATLAFEAQADYMVINRGSQIIAEGTRSRPITLTSFSDAVLNEVGPEDVSEWGGLVINGFSITNQCDYTGTVGVDLSAPNGCDVATEGTEGAAQVFYGGDNLEDSSGILKYVVVKHTGAEISAGNELNGVTFGAVGSGTEVDYLETYSTFDDGIELFGGSVNISHFVAVYVRDDSIDIDEGYRGTIDQALVIQSQTEGNHCVESDGINGYDDQDAGTISDFIERGLNSRATIKNLTCIVSPEAVGTHGPGRGILIREGHFPTIQNTIITTAFAGDEITAEQGAGTNNNWCLSITSPDSLQAADDGDLSITSSIIACQDLTGGNSLPSGPTVSDWLTLNNEVYQTDEEGQDPTENDIETDPSNLLGIFDSFYSLPLGSMTVNGLPVTLNPTDDREYLGGVIAGDEDWIQDWTYGLNEDNRGENLWFENEL